MIKKDISDYWSLLANYHFTVVGWKCHKAKWCGHTVAEIRKKLKIPYVVVFNGSVIYFDKSDISKRVFDKTKHYYKNKKEIISRSVDCGNLLRKNQLKIQYSDEPIFGSAMGYYRLEPFPPNIPIKSRLKQLIQLLKFEPRMMQLMSCTDKWQGPKYKKYVIDILKGKCILMGEDGHRRSPTILHFYGVLHPRNIYVREVNKLRKHFGLQEFGIEN
jgi:hypothetical protein